MRTLVATDLAKPGAPAFPWRTLRSALASTRGIGTGAPGASQATPAGYEFVEGDGIHPSSAPRVEVFDLPQSGRRQPRQHDPGPSHPSHRSLLTAIFPAGDRHLSPGLAGGLVIEIREGLGRVEVAGSAWDDAARPVLLAISQCWRFLQIDRELDDLDAWMHSHSDGRRTRPARGGEIEPRLRRLRTLVSDLVSSEGPLTDPRGYFETPREARLYRAIIARVGLRAWRDRIDERVEVAEAAIEALVEERRHRQLLLYEVGLEVLIFLALLLDLGVNFWYLTVE
jgi:hypothetical protein